MTQGVLYILYDLGSPIDYLDELKISIESLRKYCDLPITVYTDRDLVGQWRGFDNVNLVKIDELKELAPEEQREDQSKRGYTFLKLYALKNLPYDFTIFVDTDTYFLNDPSKLISEDNDLTICREIRYKRDAEKPLTKKFNTGFFIAKRGKNFNSLIDKAIEIRNESAIKSHAWACDQGAINQALDYTFDINLRILPQSWNVRSVIKDMVNNANLLHWHGNGLKKYGEVVELADTADLKSAERIAHAGSSPAFATNKKNAIFPEEEIKTNVDDI